MNAWNFYGRCSSSRGFALPAVMVIVAAMVVLAMGLLFLAQTERGSSRAVVDGVRAEWVAEAGLAEVSRLLKERAANDDFLVVAERRPGSSAMGPGRLWVVRGESDGRYRAWPMFSTAEEERELEELDELVETAVGDPVAFKALPWKDDVEVEWVEVLDEGGRRVGRYGFWMEDLQGYLDAERSGNLVEAGAFGRPDWPSPVAGIDERWSEDDSGAAVHALDPEADEDGGGSGLDVRLRAGRDLLVSPGAVLAAVDVEPPLSRGVDGRLADGLAREVEENLMAGLMDYVERPLVPPVRGLEPEVWGRPKVNLNELLERGESESVEEMAAWIDEALPRFSERKGGFPEDYVRTLAANALDYADADSDVRVRSGEYRGVEAMPWVSEHLMSFRWEGIEEGGDQLHYLVRAQVFLELWNPAQTELSGQLQVSFETNYRHTIGDAPEAARILGAPEVLRDPALATPQLEEEDGLFWLPEIPVTLQPNECRVVPCGGVLIRVPGGAPPKPKKVPPLVLNSDLGGKSGYSVRWNSRRVDRAHSGLRRSDGTLYLPGSSRTYPNQFVRTAAPGHRYWNGFWLNLPGDPRMAQYLAARAVHSKYPENFSPGRRNVHWGDIYAAGGAEDHRKLSGRVLISAWPDGGQDPPYGEPPPIIVPWRGEGRDGDERINPDDPRLLEGAPGAMPELAPTRISNRGRFFSVAELGHLFDPVMWTPVYDSAAETAELVGGNMPVTQDRWPDVHAAALPSVEHGGGNSLRIGRPEHPKFDEPGLRAAHWLDLFSAGDSRGDPLAKVVRNAGRVNVNTAHPAVLKALILGRLRQDPGLGRVVNGNAHETTFWMAPRTERTELGVETVAEALVDGLVAGRPFAGGADLASVKDSSGRAVFGNREMYPDGRDIRWSDAAAEEVFARLHDGITWRSRNFRVWVVGQALVPGAAGSPVGRRDLLGEARKAYVVFADPGERDAEGALVPGTAKTEVRYETEF